MVSTNYLCGGRRRTSCRSNSNLWLTVLFTVTVFLGLCVDDSFGFSTSFTTMTTNNNRVVTGTPFSPTMTMMTTTITTPSPLLTSTTTTTTTTTATKNQKSLTATTTTVAVTDAPTKPKTVEEEKIKIIKDIEDDTESKEKNGKDGWEIRLFNDPMNHRTFVAKCLCEICGKSDGESYQIMMQAHKNGMGVVGRYHYELAELYYGSLKEEGLTVEMVQVDDE